MCCSVKTPSVHRSAPKHFRGFELKPGNFFVAAFLYKIYSTCDLSFVDKLR